MSVLVPSGLCKFSEPLQVLDLAEAVPEVATTMTAGGQINIYGLLMFDAWTARCSVTRTGA